MAPLAGPSYLVDASEVHTCITKFVAGNYTTEAKVQPHLLLNNDRTDFIALKDYYGGVGVNSIGILKADQILEMLHYTGEKKPHMWWAEFEIQMIFAFSAYTKKEGRTMHSDEMKMRILLRKTKADFLGTTKIFIEVSMTNVPRTITYEQAMSAFQQKVNGKFSP